MQNYWAPRLVGSARFFSTDDDISAVKFAWDTELERELRETHQYTSPVPSSLIELSRVEWRPKQREICGALLSGFSAYARLPTGSGKTLIFLLVARIANGIVLVVSPLVALMEQQETLGAKLGIPTFAFRSGRDENARVFEQYEMLPGDGVIPGAKQSLVLFVTPEFLCYSHRMHRLLTSFRKKGLMRLVVMEEAHTLQSWSSFRHALLCAFAPYFSKGIVSESAIAAAQAL
jgi:superfamily II DNA or RNA helicase